MYIYPSAYNYWTNTKVKIMNPEIVTVKQMDDQTIEKLVILVYTTWPPKDSAVSVKDIVTKIKNRQNPDFEKHVLLWNHDRLIGHALIFARDVLIDNKMIHTLALAQVCVVADARGNGYGKMIVKAAFEFVDNKQFACSFFQSQAPQFYEKLGAKIIQNRFYNTFVNTTGSPWWDPYVMLYPKEYPLPDSAIDLRGAGY